MQQAVVIEQVLNAIVERLVAEYQPEQVILYGSYAYGTPDESSDLDLFIVKETEGSFYHRWAEVEKVLGDLARHPWVQAYVLTPGEVEQRLAIGDHFIEEILDKGHVLYGKAIYRRPQRTKEMDGLYAEEWYPKAERDLRLVRLLLRQEETWAAFLLGQAIEKFLKAYLISKGWRLERTHDLAELLDEAAKYHPPLLAYQQVCRTIAKFYTADRYPLEPGEPDPLEGRPLTMAWIQECLNGVTPLIEFMREQFPPQRK